MYYKSNFPHLSLNTSNVIQLYNNIVAFISYYINYIFFRLWGLMYFFDIGKYFTGRIEFRF